MFRSGRTDTKSDLVAVLLVNRDMLWRVIYHLFVLGDSANSTSH